MKIFGLIGIVAVVVFLLMELPVVTGRGAEEVKEVLAQTETIELSGKTLFISDLHLTAEPALQQQFNLDFSDVQNVVIVGDFFHTSRDFATFGSTEEERLRNVLQEIVPENFSGQVFFIHSTTHDPQLSDGLRIEFEDFTFIHIGEYGKFEVNSIPVVAYHGQQLHGGFAGGGLSWLAGKVGLPLVFEKLGKERFDIPEEAWVMNGHSHVPGIDYEAKVANTGSFVGAPFNKFLFRMHIGTGVLFEGDRVEFQEYEGLNIKELYAFVL